MTAHLNWETLNDVADSQLSGPEQTAAMAHLADCGACVAQLNALRALQNAATSAPDSMEPPPEVWADIQHVINAGKTVAFPRTVTPAGAAQWSRRQLAAAALVLITVSSTVTAVVMRQPNASHTIGDAGPVTVAPMVNTATASEIILLEEEYLATAASLRDALNNERSALSPTTIATVERSLKIIDDAIAEAREALVADPANTALREMLRRSHQQKIDFLRRTTSLLEQA